MGTAASDDSPSSESSKRIDSECHQQKRLLRKQIRQRRQQKRSRPDKAKKLTGFLQQLTQEHQATMLTAFLSTPTEPNLWPFLDWCLGVGDPEDAEPGSRQGLRPRVLLPVSREDGLLDWRIWKGSSAPGMFAIEEPEGEALPPLAVTQVELMFIPAAAVDRRGCRLGWGRGYFDRTLGSLSKPPPVYAVVFEEEIFDEVPAGPCDQPVDGVVTPAGISHFRQPHSPFSA